jgi:hypothetical protein
MTWAQYAKEVGMSLAVSQRSVSSTATLTCANTKTGPSEWLGSGGPRLLLPVYRRRSRTRDQAAPAATDRHFMPCPIDC